MELILFYTLAALAIGSAILVVSLKNLVRSLFLFFVTLLAVAGLYVFALADFVAVTQVLVYVGGVLVLMLFAFMLSNQAMLSQLQEGTKTFFQLPGWQALLLALLFFALLLFGVYNVYLQQPEWIVSAIEEKTLIKASDDTVKHIGFNLMTRYLLPLEVVSIFLMIALVGAAHIARKVGLR